MTVPGGPNDLFTQWRNRQFVSKHEFMRRWLFRLLVFDYIIKCIAQFQRFILQEGVSQQQYGRFRLTKRQTAPHSIPEVGYSAEVESGLCEVCFDHGHELESQVKTDIVIITTRDVHVALQRAALTDVKVKF